MNYIKDLVTLTIAHPGGFSAGDYLLLYHNDGAGAIDYTAAVTPKQDLTAASPLTLTITASQAGIWSFGAETYDSKGNASGTPAEDDLTVDLVPAVPAGFMATYAGGIITFT